MSMPFGGHPTLGQYIAWARSEGCSAQSGYEQNEDGDIATITRIVSTDGKQWVIEVGTDQREFLTPTTIARFDRRLGLKSPWFSIDDSSYQPTEKS